ncbi:nucleolar MIF4G domain-containing protein 1 isoform X2 [Sphaerodactylus townsendi]|uniref:nucleolar MIF4G domain-containing protein 1 isoform X2 n=1 Tax=Sphaerodactylus townsendi TaxID=933632 RepID=UPI002026D2FD|nr:nucleolar MIF4G domain-containing protein 1 isoform X2 [Sphaerodactylus townsendi]
MKPTASSSGPVKGPAQRKGRGKKQAGRLQKLGMAVREFVEAAGGSASPGALLQQQPPKWSGRRNRRELKREKRKLKRGRRRLLLSGKEAAEARSDRPPCPASGDREQRPPKTKKAPQPPTPEKRVPAAEGRPARPSPAPSATSLTRKRALLEANEAEEREIRRLERQLGLSKRRKKQAGQGEASLPQSFSRDGLGYVLGALGSGAAFSGLYESSEGEEDAEEEEEVVEGRSEEEEEGLSSQEEEMEDEGDALATEEDAGCSEESSVEEEGQAEEGESPEALSPGSPREEKEMRRSEETVDVKKREELERLKKTLKGLVNRLSEPNLASISGQLEELYMTNSRKDMNETLTDVLLSACVTLSVMPSRLMMEHVLLVSVLHNTVGIEVGAHFLETVVRKFDDIYRSKVEGKECENLLSLIGHLYNFYVVNSLLIFDILKKLAGTFSEQDIELILLLLKNVGFSLRKDDALALKELITETQKKANAVGKQFQDQSRVCFMLETMLALKNNDMRKIPGYDPEPVEKLRKLQRTLIHNSGSGKEAQLRVSLESLLSADQIGRWWIVGSSWSGAPMIDASSNKAQHILPTGKVSSKILQLARKQRMNTDIRRNIFCILMTSEDFLDAFEKLLKLGLKDQQEREIVHVLVDCCLQEKTYNPFYAYLSAKFCEYDRRFQMTFQFAMWDRIRDLGNLSRTAFSNLVNLLAHLLKTKSISLAVFKIIEFSELDKPKVHFLRQALSTLFLKTDPEELCYIFGKLAENPKLGMLHEGLKLFLTHFLMKNIQANKSASEATLLKERIELVNRTLKAKESRLKL